MPEDPSPSGPPPPDPTPSDAGTLSEDWPRCAPALPAGTGICLRLPTTDDMDEIVAICRDPDVQAWTTIPADYTRTDAEAWLRHTAGGWERCQEFGFVGVDETTGAIVGTVGVRAVRADRRIADIGYTVGPRFRGREIAPHMVRLVRAWTLGVWPVERFQIHVYVGNTRSERVAEKCGFQREGVLRRYGDQRGVLRDAVMFSWLPGEG